MSVIQTVRHGAFFWPELCSADVGASREFYTSLFPWQVEDMHMDGGGYTIFKVGGDGVAGMYQTSPERLQAGVAPHWNSYVSVANVDETAKQAVALGGKVTVEPITTPDGNRQAVIQDPTGAKVVIWQSQKPLQSRVSELHALCWSELYTRNAAQAQEFYVGLFKWKAEPMAGGPMPYTVFTAPGGKQGTGGMIEMTPQMPGDAHWLPYIMVEDPDKIAARTKELGGSVICGPFDIPNVGRIVLLKDPQQAQFAVIAPKME